MSYHARAAYYENLAEAFRKVHAYDSVRFYMAVATCCRELAKWGRAA